MSICLKISEIQQLQKTAFEVCQNSQDYEEKRLAIFNLSNAGARALIALKLENYEIKINCPKNISDLKPETVFLGKQSEDLIVFYETTIAITTRAINFLRRLDKAEHDVLLNTYKSFPKIPELVESAEFDSPIETTINLNFKFEKCNVMPETIIPVPIGQPIFEKITMPVFEKVEIGKASYGIEHPDLTRTFTDDHRILNFIKETDGRCEPVHEVLRKSCKFVADLDDKENQISRERFLNLLDALRQLVPSFIKQYFELTAELYFNFLVAISQAAYNSAHIYIDIFDADGNYYYAKSAANQGIMWAHFVDYFNSHCDTIDLAHFLDSSIYRQNAQLRLPGTRKNGFLLEPVPSEIFEIRRRTEAETIELRKKFSFMTDEEFKRVFVANAFGDAKNTVVDTAPAKYYNAAASTYKAIVLEAKKQLGKIRNYTSYEKLLFEQILAHSQLTVGDLKPNRSNPNSVFSQVCFRVYCFYKADKDGIVKAIKVVKTFFKNKNFVAGDADRLFAKWNLANDYFGFSIQALAKFFKYEPVSKMIVDEKRIVYPEFDRVSVLALKSGCNTGKTYSMIKKAKDEGKKMMLVSVRVSLSSQFRETAEKHGVDMALYYENFSGAPQFLAVQIDSLCKFAGLINEYDYIFFDECEALVSRIAALSDPVEKRVLSKIFDNIFQNKKSIFCSANLGQRTLDFLAAFKAKFHFIENIYKDKADYEIQTCDNGYFLNKLESDLKNGKKCVVAASTVKDAVKIADAMKNYKVLIQSAVNSYKTYPKVPVNDWKNFDLVVYTSCIMCGVSIEYEYFDSVYGYFNRGVGLFDEAFQMLFRVRNPKSKLIHLCFVGATGLVQPDRFTEEVAELAVRFETAEKSTNKRELIDELYFEYARQNMVSPMEMVAVKQKLFETYNARHFKSLLLNELWAAGARNLGYKSEKLTLEIERSAPPEEGVEDVKKKRATARQNIEMNAISTGPEMACKLLMEMTGQGLDSEKMGLALNEIFEKFDMQLKAVGRKRKYALDTLKKMQTKGKVAYVQSFLKIAGLTIVNDGPKGNAFYRLAEL